MSKRLALIIGSSLYRDETLARLVSPDADVGALADTLLDPEMGGFDDVKLLVNMASYTVRREISEFFSRRTREDLLLFYFSGHGVLDDRGQLYLAVKDTDAKLLRGTAIPARYITEEMDNSYSQRQVLILDCCHSGAFARGTKGSPGSSVGTASTFEGTGFGRVVLTASDATQYAWEGNQVIGEAQNSLFTHFLIQGIQTGEADANQDGQITVDELFDYAYSQILSQTPKQTPGKWSFKEQGELIIARAPGTHPIQTPAPKPGYLDQEQEQQLQKLYTDGLSAFWLEDWEKACQNFAAILEIRPDYQDVAAKLTQAEHRKKIDGLYQMAAAKYQAGELAASIKLYETLLTEVLDYKDARQKLEQIGKEKKLADLAAEAQQLFDSGKFEAVVKIYESIQALAPNFLDKEGLLEKARYEAQQLERNRMLEELYRRAILELDRGKYKEAKQLFLQIREEEEDFKDTGKLLERVDKLIVEEAEQAIEAQKAETGVSQTSAKVSFRRLAGLPRWALVLGAFVAVAALLLGGYWLAERNQPLTPEEKAAQVQALTSTAFHNRVSSLVPVPTKTLIPTYTPRSTESTSGSTNQIVFGPLTPIPTTKTNPKDKAVMVLIPAGEFEFGSDENGQPTSTEYLPEFWIYQKEITNAMYSKCVRAGNCSLPENTYHYNDGRYDNHPVTFISFSDAENYCSWAGGRLPTNLEWEKAARGNDGRTYPWGEGISCDLAQYKACGGSTVPVGSYPKGASPYGALDMAGNVWEFVADYGIRGGGWNYDENFAQINSPGIVGFGLGGDTSASHIGFRCMQVD